MTQRWYVIRSKPRKEEFLAEQMQLRKLEIFEPLIRVQTVNPRARKIKPYFPGYVFVQLDLEKTGKFSVEYIPGAAGLVSFGGEEADVPDGLIHAIRQRVEEINGAGGELFDALKNWRDGRGSFRAVRRLRSHLRCTPARLGSRPGAVETAQEPPDAGGSSSRANSPEEIAPLFGPARPPAGDWLYAKEFPTLRGCRNGGARHPPDVHPRRLE